MYSFRSYTKVSLTFYATLSDRVIVVGHSVMGVSNK